MTVPSSSVTPSQRRQARALVSAGVLRGRVLTSRESKAVLALYGVRTPREILAPNFEDAVGAVEEIGYPVVLKAEAPGLVRKTEAGAIMLDVGDEATLRRCFKRVLTNAWGAVPAFTVSGVLVQELIPSGTEVVVEMRREERFRPVVSQTLDGAARVTLRESLERLAELCHDLGDLVDEIEIRPLIVTDDTACALDCVIVPAG